MIILHKYQNITEIACNIIIYRYISHSLYISNEMVLVAGVGYDVEMINNQKPLHVAICCMQW